MTPRAWLLLVAAAALGVFVALIWPAALEEPPIIIPDRQLVDADVDRFLAVCNQLQSDREAVRIELPYGHTLKQFAAEASARPSRIVPTCERAGVPAEEFLAIALALGDAQQVDARYLEWERRADARTRDEDLAAAVLEAHGHTAPPIPAPEAGPDWWQELSDRERANRGVWERRGSEVAERWAELMRKPGTEQ